MERHVESSLVDKDTDNGIRQKTNLSVLVEECGIIHVPEPVLTKMFSDAALIYSTGQFFSPVPHDHTSPKCNVVDIEGHICEVICQDSSLCDFLCNCAVFNGFKLCAHTLAVAERNGKLRSFLDRYKKKSVRPRLINMVNTNLPAGRGKKANRATERRKGGRTSQETTSFIDTESADLRPLEPHERAALSMPKYQQPATTLSVTAEESGITGFSVAKLKSTWEEASKICANEASICLHPCNPDQVVVYDVNNVYQIKKLKCGLFACETSCVDFTTLDALFCKHTLAVAERTGGLWELLSVINMKISSKSAHLLNDARKNRKRKSSTVTSTFTPMQSGSRFFTEQRANETMPSNPTGSQAVCSNHSTMLPPLTPLQISMQERQPFSITFRQGLIKRCQGCKQLFSEKTRTRPHDIILKKLDFKEYTQNGIWHRSNTLANSYYHLKIDCVRRNFPQTQIKDIIIHDEIMANVDPGHINLLHKFGFHAACTHD